MNIFTECMQEPMKIRREIPLELVFWTGVSCHGDGGN